MTFRVATRQLVAFRKLVTAVGFVFGVVIFGLDWVRSRAFPEMSSTGYWVTVAVVSVVISGLFLLWSWRLAVLELAEEGPAARKRDREKMQWFLSELPSDSPGVRWLADHDFGLRFDPEPMYQVKGVAKALEIPERRFANAEMAQAVDEFLACWWDFHGKLALSVFEDDRPNDRRLGTQYALKFSDFPSGLNKEADEATEVVCELNALAAEAYEAHAQVMSTAVKLGLA